MVTSNLPNNRPHVRVRERVRSPHKIILCHSWSRIKTPARLPQWYNLSMQMFSGDSYNCHNNKMEILSAMPGVSSQIGSHDSSSMLQCLLQCSTNSNADCSKIMPSLFSLWWSKFVNNVTVINNSNVKVNTSDALLWTHDYKAIYFQSTSKCSDFIPKLNVHICIE